MTNLNIDLRPETADYAEYSILYVVMCKFRQYKQPVQ